METNELIKKLKSHAKEWNLKTLDKKIDSLKDDPTGIQRLYNDTKKSSKWGKKNLIQKENKMKRSKLTEFIKEEIVSVLSESTEEEVEKTKELTAATKELAKAKEEAGISEDTVSEGTWSSGTSTEIGRFIQDIKNLKDKYYNIVGNDDVFDGLDRAELSAREMMIDAPENRSDLNEDDMDDDEMDKAAAKGVKGKDAKGISSQYSSELSKQKMKQKVADFKAEMVKKGIVDSSGKILDTAKYKEEFAKFKSKKK